MTSGGGVRSSEVIDFSLERSRHEHFFGRQDVLAELDRLVALKPVGFVLLLGGPGIGKSAILSHWLARREQRGEVTPHHFLRRGVNRWDEPDVVRSNLAARIEALYPAQRDEGAPPERRFEELLARVSEQVLAPEKKRLVLVLDGLDEAAVRDEHDNPISRILPYRLPREVVAVCASRPKYPHLAWLEQRDQMVRPPLDLAQPAWAASNVDAVAAYWAFARDQFSPTLSQALVDAAVRGAQGNLLYSIKLSEWLESLPVEERQDAGIVARLPQGLEALLEDLWGQLQASPGEASAFVRQCLGLLAVAREALPARCIEMALGWDPGTADARLLRTSARQAIIEEPAEWHGKREPRYRLYHESFGELVRAKMAGGLPDLHRRLTEHVAAWPPTRAADLFFRTYALRYGIVHRVEAARNEADWQAIERLCLDVGYLRNAIVEAGSLAIEDTLARAIERCSFEVVTRTLDELRRALIKDSHWLHSCPEALPSLLWNRLSSQGWPGSFLRRKLLWPPGEPARGLKHPLHRIDQSVRVVPAINWFNACAVAAGGKLAVSGSPSGYLQAWDLTSGREILRFGAHDSWVLACALSPDEAKVVSGSLDKTLRAWSLENGQEIGRFVGHKASVNACAILPDGKRVASVSDDRTVRLWEMESGAELLCLEGHDEEIMGCAISPDGTRLVSCARDHTLRVWDLMAGREMFCLNGHSDGVEGCAISPDGTLLVSGSRDCSLRIWDLANGQELVKLVGHAEGVLACVFTPDGNRIVSGSFDRTIRVWDVRGGRELVRFEGHSGWVQTCAVTRDAATIISSSSDDTLRVWDFKLEPGTARPQGHTDEVTCCAITADGSRVVSGSLDHTLRLWDFNGGSELLRFEGHSDAVCACALSSEGSRLVSASRDRTVRVWDLESGRELLRLDGHSQSVYACAIAPDGKRVVSGSFDKSLKVWDLESGLEVIRFEGHKGIVKTCAISPDGSRVASTSQDGVLIVWSLLDGRQLMMMHAEEHIAMTECCVFLSDSKRLVSASQDGTLRVWNLESGGVESKFEGHRGGVWSCALTLDEERLVSASFDSTLRIWSPRTGACLGTIHGTSRFKAISIMQGLIAAGDTAGNVWFLIERPAEPSSSQNLRSALAPLHLPHREAPTSLCHVLFLASNPDATRVLAIGTELRSIREEIERSGRAGFFNLDLRSDLRLDDLRRSLNSIGPSIVHFGGHGAGASGLLFHDDRGGTRLADAEALRDLFSLTAERIRLVVLNACYSAEQARSLVEVVDCVVGMTRAIEDEAACRFAAAFYGALASGRSVKNAFAQGVWAMKHGGAGGVRGAGPTEREAEAFVRTGRVSDDEHEPKLLVREGVDADQVVFAPPLRP